MTEQIANVSSDVDNAHTVEVFLSALQDEDFDGAAAVLDDNVVYQNVGFPTIRGKARTVNLFRGMQGRMGFEVKIHRIAVNGATVLTERTDALVFGPVRVQPSEFMKYVLIVVQAQAIARRGPTRMWILPS